MMASSLARGCASRVERFECIYVANVKHEKGELAKQIKELKAKNHATEQILQALPNDGKAPETLDRLKNGKTYESIVEWLGRLPKEDFETLSPSRA
jgi:CRISPR/Cas system-associated endonuclease Cas1